MKELLLELANHSADIATCSVNWFDLFRTAVNTRAAVFIKASAESWTSASRKLEGALGSFSILAPAKAAEKIRPVDVDPDLDAFADEEPETIDMVL